MYGPCPDSGKAEAAAPVTVPSFPGAETGSKGGAVSPETEAPALDSGETAAGKEPGGAKVFPRSLSADSEGWP